MPSSARRTFLFLINFNYVLIESRLTKSYVEGMAWVLHYYYQGVRQSASSVGFH
jgi:hypothetical protein